MWIPLTFIFLFSTGFVAARFGVEDAEPFTLLLVRSLLVLPLLALILFVRRKPRQWSTPKARLDQMGIGMLLHGAYLGGVFAAIKAGLPAGLTALLVSMHPLATAALSLPVFGIRLNARQWTGLALGALGVMLVLGAGLVFLIAASLVGSFTFTPTPRLILTMSWLVIAISVGAIWLLMLMLERGEAHQVARLFFLVPPCAAFMAYVLFDEQWTLGMVIGAVLVVSGLALDRPGTPTATAASKP